MWDGIFNGTYETSRYASRSLEDDIMEAGCGRFAYEGPNGELIKQSDDKIEIWGEGGGNGHYPHRGYRLGEDKPFEADINRHDW